MASAELQEVIALLRARPAPDVSTPEGLAAYREGIERLTAAYPGPPGILQSPADAGGVPGAWFAPQGIEAGRLLLFLHGGAYVRGSVASHRPLIAGLAAAGGVTALAVDYRLAPEHPFPAALEDAVRAYRWLLATGADPARLVVAGDSAGGGLVLATLVALRDAGDPLPAAAVGLSPWTDLALTGESLRTHAAEDPFLDRGYLETMARCYLGGADPRDPLASPLYADPAGLPPLLIQVGTAEILLDDSRRVAGRAHAAGVAVTCEEWPEMIHVWHLFAAVLPEGEQAVAAAGEWVRQRLDAS